MKMNINNINVPINISVPDIIRETKNKQIERQEVSHLRDEIKSKLNENMSELREYIREMTKGDKKRNLKDHEDVLSRVHAIINDRDDGSLRDKERMSRIEKEISRIEKIPNGKDGLNGTDGKDGLNGTDGKDGLNGTDGKDGDVTNGKDVEPKDVAPEDDDNEDDDKFEDSISEVSDDEEIDDDDVLDGDDDLFEDIKTCDLEKLNKPKFDDYKNAMTIYKDSDIFDNIVYIDANTGRGERNNIDIRKKARIVTVRVENNEELISLSETPIGETFWVCNRDLNPGVSDSGYTIVSIRDFDPDGPTKQITNVITTRTNLSIEIERAVLANSLDIEGSGELRFVLLIIHLYGIHVCLDNEIKTLVKGLGRQGVLNASSLLSIFPWF